jgi:predicted Zn-dependent protease
MTAEPLEALRHCVHASPGHPYYARFAATQLESDEARAALQTCERGLAANPRDSAGLLVAARCHLALGDLRAARAHARRALRVLPDLPGALTILAEVHKAEGTDGMARRDLARAMVLSPPPGSLRAYHDTLNAKEPVLQPEPFEREDEPAAGPKPLVIDAAGLCALKAQWEQVAGEREASVAPEPQAVPSAPVESGERGDWIAACTLAELYTAQGLVNRALEVYRLLLARSPEDEALQRRIRELQAQAASGDSAR